MHHNTGHATSREPLSTGRTDDRMLDSARATAHKGDAEIAALVDSHVPLARTVARRFRHIPIPQADLVGIGVCALRDAAQRFDPTRGASFATYAVIIIRQHMLAAIRGQVGPCRFPRARGAFVQQVLAASDQLRGRLRRDPCAEEVATLLSASARRVQTVLASRWSSAVSFDQPVGEDRSSLLDLFTDENALTARDAIQQTEKLVQLRRELSGLPDRDRHVLELRHGLTGGREHTFAEIADIVGLSKERVRQLAELAIVKLRRRMAA